MKFLQIFGLEPIAKANNTQYTSFVFDGFNFYFLNHGSCIISKFDKHLIFVENLECDRNYNSICYDSKDNCFWACSVKNYNHLYKLDLDLKEIDFLVIKNLEKGFGSVTGLAYSFENDRLMLSYNSRIIQIKKKEKSKITIIQNDDETIYNNILCLKDCYVCSIVRNNINCCSLYCNDDKLLLQFSLPIEFCVVDITIVNLENGNIYILASKNKLYFYVLKCVLSEFGIVQNKLENKDKCQDCDVLYLKDMVID